MSKSTQPPKEREPIGEDIVTEESICVEFCASIDSQLFDSNEKTIKFLGLDTNEVILQLSSGSVGNAFFSGEVQHMFGTNVLFEIKDKPNDEMIDNKSLHFIGKCDQKLVLKRVFIESKHKTND